MEWAVGEAYFVSLIPGTRLLARLAALRSRFDGAGVSALLVTDPANVFYLSNFRGTAGMLLVGLDRASLIVDARYISSATALLESTAGCPGMATVEVTGSYEETLVDLVVERGADPVGFESRHVTVGRHDWLVGALAESRIELLRTAGLVEQARVVKDADELEKLRDAGLRISRVMSEALAGLRPGRQEREVAADIDRAIQAVGFEGPSFDTIVAGGPNTALPHARPGRRELEAGDLVLLDFGGVLDGYCVDLSRTASLGPPTGEAMAWHRAVCEGHAAALEVVRPGATVGEVDSAARLKIEQHGLGERFVHGTGHGLGLEVHEAPRIGKRDLSALVPEDEVVLESGMVFTIEPGVYLPSRGGVRLEDDLAVTSTGYELLTDVSRGLCVV